MCFVVVCVVAYKECEPSVFRGCWFLELHVGFWAFAGSPNTRHSALNLSKIAALTMRPLERHPSTSRKRSTDKVPHIAAGKHFMRENAGYGAISNFQASPGRSVEAAIPIQTAKLVVLPCGLGCLNCDPVRMFHES